LVDGQGMPWPHRRKVKDNRRGVEQVSAAELKL
jgi:hypothetical protein